MISLCSVLFLYQNSKAKVYIEERTKVADVTFPDRPMVLSLRDYDNPEQADDNPVQGYPLICVTVRRHNQ